MKRKSFFEIFILVVIVVLLFAGCKTGSAEKEIVISYNSWLRYNFEEACEAAEKIIIGEVASVSRTFVERISDDPYSDGTYMEAGFTVLNISVEETLKGVHQDTIEYIQAGCETEDRIFICDDGAYNLNIGERVLIFIGSNGMMLTPAFLRPIDADGNIQTGYFPEGYVSTASADSNTISADDYAGLIKDYLEN